MTDTTLWPFAFEPLRSASHLEGLWSFTSVIVRTG